MAKGAGGAGRGAANNPVAGPVQDATSAADRLAQASRNIRDNPPEDLDDTALIDAEISAMEDVDAAVRQVLSRRGGISSRDRSSLRDALDRALDAPSGSDEAIISANNIRIILQRIGR